MGNYKGIKTVSKNDKTYIMVRFKHLGKDYGVRNFTNLFGCKTQKSAYNKLQEVKILISQGKDPFIKSAYNLNDIFKEKIRIQKNDNEWSENTIANYELFYEKVIKAKIGYKKLHKITYEDLKNILESKEVIGKSNVWKNRLKQILNPIFKEALFSGEVNKNPCDGIKSFKTNEGDSIYDKVVDKNILYVAQKLYSTISKYPTKSKSNQIETKCFLYLVLLSSHRFGEILKLTKEDCYLKYKKIISPKNITKTKISSEFPIPDECLDHIESVNTGLLFKNIERASVYLMFQRLVKLSDLDLIKNKKLTVHDTRSLMLNIMIENGVDSLLADYCLDHKQQGTIKGYLGFTYERKCEAYELYWKLVRKDELAIEKEKFRKEFFKKFEYEFEKAWKKKLSTQNE